MTTEAKLELTDLHNRRSNIASAAKYAQAHAYPLLVWPEDRELLRLADLPIVTREACNTPRNWSNLATSAIRLIRSDDELRKWIKVDRAYTREVILSGSSIVTEFTVDTYGGRNANHD